PVRTVGSLGPLLEGRGRRRRADEFLLWGRPPAPSDNEVRSRVMEICSARRRRALAKSVRRIEREACDALTIGPVPLNRRAIRRNVNLLRPPDDRPFDEAHPVHAPPMPLPTS